MRERLSATAVDNHSDSHKQSDWSKTAIAVSVELLKEAKEDGCIMSIISTIKRSNRPTLTNSCHLKEEY